MFGIIFEAKEMSQTFLSNAIKLLLSFFLIVTGFLIQQSLSLRKRYSCILPSAGTLRTDDLLRIPNPSSSLYRFL